VRAGVIAGQVTTSATIGGEPVWTRALVDLAPSVEEAIAQPATWLRAAGAEAARHFDEVLSER
jgi:glycerate kinase